MYFQLELMHSPKEDNTGGWRDAPMQRNGNNMQNPATAAPPPPVKYKCARCSISVTDIDEWNHHLETCL
jgi:hypothetical protein